MKIRFSQSSEIRIATISEAVTPEGAPDSAVAVCIEAVSPKPIMIYGPTPEDAHQNAIQFLQELADDGMQIQVIHWIPSHHPPTYRMR